MRHYWTCIHLSPRTHSRTDDNSKGSSQDQTFACGWHVHVGVCECVFLAGHFPSFAKDMLYVCNMNSLFPMLLQEPGSSRNIGSQLSWKTRLILGKKPYNIELILVQRPILLRFEYQFFKYPEIDDRETAQYKIKTKVVLNAHLNPILWYCHKAKDKKIMQNGGQSTSSG